MSVVADARGSRVRISDPVPAACSCCFQGAREGVRFLDFNAALDRGQFVREVDGAVLVRDVMDDLHLCEACVREAAEVLALKPQLDANQRREIRRLELESEHWRDYAKRLEATLQERPDLAPRAPRKRGGR